MRFLVSETIREDQASGLGFSYVDQPLAEDGFTQKLFWQNLQITHYIYQVINQLSFYVYFLNSLLL